MRKFHLPTDSCFSTVRQKPVATHCPPQPECMGGRAGGGGGIAPSFCQILQNLPFLPQILAFLCLQAPLTFQSAPALSNSLHRLWNGANKYFGLPLPLLSKILCATKAELGPVHIIMAISLPQSNPLILGTTLPWCTSREL